MILSSVSALGYLPTRIVSVVPSQTELLHSLGLDVEVVGVTKFCIHPKDWFQTKTKIGGTKTIHIEKVTALQPDLIIANKEENERVQIEALAKKQPVWLTDVPHFSAALQMINDIGQLVGKSCEAERSVQKIQVAFRQLPAFSKPLKTLYLIWQKPYMTIGGDTFINNMLEKCGLQNVFSHKKRYPEISIDQIKEEAIQLLLLPSEPYPFKQKHVAEWQKILPRCKICLVNGEYFSWYGSRLLQSPVYFNKIFNAFA